MNELFPVVVGNSLIVQNSDQACRRLASWHLIYFRKHVDALSDDAFYNNSLSASIVHLVKKLFCLRELTSTLPASGSPIWPDEERHPSQSDVPLVPIFSHLATVVGCENDMQPFPDAYLSAPGKAIRSVRSSYDAANSTVSLPWHAACIAPLCALPDAPQSGGGRGMMPCRHSC